MKAVFRAVLKEGVVSFFALIALLLLVFFGAQYVETQLTSSPDTVDVVKKWKYPILIGLLVLWISSYVTQRILAVRSAMAIEARLRADAEKQVADSRPDQSPQVKELQTRLQDAIQTLKRSRLGKSALHRLPWYVIIGPPGSGKTTALQESGLNFPYANQGSLKLKGVGGTRNCDWWFTDEGILLDTAGRYTTELEDRDEWLSFLRMLAKTRKRKPINGAIVAMSVHDLLSATDEEIKRHAENVLARLNELVHELEVVFPVYVLFTKVDLLQGFVDFFGELNAEQRGEICGFTMPVGSMREPTNVAGAFTTQCRRLFTALCARRSQLLASERTMEAKERIHAFPLQFALAIPRLERFLTLAFPRSDFEDSAMLRGFYFTSGTQEGNPIDQLLEAIARATRGESTSKSVVPAPTDKKSYFLTQLFRRVIFLDQGLARRTTTLERRMRAIRIGGSVATIAATILLCVGLIQSYRGNREMVTNMEEAMSKLRLDDVKRTPKDRLANLDELGQRIVEMDKNASWTLGFGLSQHTVVGEKAVKLYMNEANQIFFEGERREYGVRAKLKDLIHQWERDLNQQAIQPPGGLMKLLAGAAILRGDAPCNKKVLKELLEGNDMWTNAVIQAVPDANEEVKTSALGYLDTFLSVVGNHSVPLRHNLNNAEEKDERKRHRTLESSYGIYSSYNELILTEAVNAVPRSEWLKDVKEELKPLLEVSYDIPKLYTNYIGQSEFERNLKARADDYVACLEIVGLSEGVKSQGESEALDRLRKIHSDERVREWRGLFRNVKAKKLNTITSARSALSGLSEPENSPVIVVLRKLGRERASVLDAGGRHAIDEECIKKALKSLNKVREALDAFKGSGLDQQAVWKAIHGNEFASFNNEIEDAKETVKREMEKVDPEDRAAVIDLFNSVFKQVEESVKGSAREEASDFWGRHVEKHWNDKLASKFPFDPASEAFAKVEDLRTMFANPDVEPKGAIWEANERLKEYAAVHLIDVPNELGKELKLAKDIADALFPSGHPAAVMVKVRQPSSRVDKITLIVDQGIDINTSVRTDFQIVPWNYNDSNTSFLGQIKVLLREGVEHPSKLNSDDRIWGLFKLLSKCEKVTPSQEAPGALEFVHVEEFPSKYGGVENVTWKVVGAPAYQGENPLGPYFFRFKCPSKKEVVK